MCPFLSNKIKQFGSIISYTVLAGWLLFIMIRGLQFSSVLDITKIFFEQTNFLLFGFPIIFILDNLTCIFCFLVIFLIVICLLITWISPVYQTTKFLLLIWILGFSLFHTFTSLNLLVFFIFFEITLIPMILFILIWGSRQRKIHAMYVFFFYTIFGSIFLLIGLLLLNSVTNTLLITNLAYLKLPQNLQIWIWLFFFLGFGIKVPIFPLHTWLPEAHVEAPTVGSIILAGLLLKIGTFGMLRFMFPLLNTASSIFQPLVFTISIISIYHASLIAFRQYDLKKIIAYSSVAHMGFVILGLFSFNVYGILGSIFIMFSHGIVASALFFLIGVLYERYSSRSVFDYSGLATIMPVFTCFFFFFILANLSFPGTSNFAGELITLIGITETNYFVSFLTTLSIILTSAYSIWVFNRISFGTVSAKLRGFSDLNKYEFYVSVLFCGLSIIFGINPNLLLNGIDTIPFFLISNK